MSKGASLYNCFCFDVCLKYFLIKKRETKTSLNINKVLTDLKSPLCAACVSCFTAQAGKAPQALCSPWHVLGTQILNNKSSHSYEESILQGN